MNAKAHERLAVEARLRRAVEVIQDQTGPSEFEIYYQPKVDNQHQVVGLEALLRWNCDGSQVSPAQFIPLAEETGLIVHLGSWALREACRQNQVWQRQGLPPVKIAVNVSALQFAQGDFTAVVASILQQAALAPCWLELEITETLLMQNTNDAIAKLHELRRMGVSVAVDDFGTGYSSLAYLHRLPIDTLKIDRSFISDIKPEVLRSPIGTDTAVIRAIASLAQSLGLAVVAEGVQEEHQRVFLQGLGCQGMQGYLFGHPMPADKIAQILRSSPRKTLPKSA
jgi:EAL domain-containing protein (putative c-di-GMP-specific phosphodiesterase class I)